MKSRFRLHIRPSWQTLRIPGDEQVLEAAAEVEVTYRTGGCARLPEILSSKQLLRLVGYMDTTSTLPGWPV